MIACTVLAAALTAVVPSLRMSSVPTETPARVRLAQVEYGDIEQLAMARGAVRYEQEYAAIAPVTGIVAEVYVEPGDRVTAGQPLLRLDASAEEAALAAAYSTQAEITAEASAWPDGLPVSFLQDSTVAETQARLAAMTLRAAADGQVVDVTTGQYAGILAGSSAVLLCGGQQEIICDVAACDAADLRKGMRAQASANGCTPWNFSHVQRRSRASAQSERMRSPANPSARSRSARTATCLCLSARRSTYPFRCMAVKTPRRCPSPR